MAPATKAAAIAPRLVIVLEALVLFSSRSKAAQEETPTPDELRQVSESPIPNDNEIGWL